MTLEVEQSHGCSWPNRRQCVKVTFHLQGHKTIVFFFYLAKFKSAILCKVYKGKNIGKLTKSA